MIMYTVLKIYFLKINGIFTFQVATAGILKFCLRGLLGERQQESLYKFFDAISDLCSDKQAVGNDDLQNNLNYACALMERDWPVSLQVRVKSKLTKPCVSTDTLVNEPPK